MPDNLWGELPVADATAHPRELLREQATILAERTNGIIQARVVEASIEASLGNDAVLRFEIVCPTLSNYSFDVMFVSFNRIDLYPIRVVADGSDLSFEVENEEDYKRAVARVLQSERVKKVIAALLRDAKR